MSLSNVKISVKLPAIIVILALASILITGLLAYTKSADNMRIAADDSMQTLIDSRTHSIMSLMEGIRQDLGILSSNQMVKDALVELAVDYEDIGAEYGDATAFLQKEYIEDNSNSAGERDKLKRGQSEDAYHDTHQRYHAWFQPLAKSRAYHDLFIVDAKGNVIYSVYKAHDFATNLEKGKWKDTDFAKIFKEIKENGDNNAFVTMTDFAAYEADNNEAASFMGSPVKNEEDVFVGALIVRMPIKRIDQVMQNPRGLGNTGETYIVGKDNLLRSDLRLVKEKTIIKQKISNEAVKAALKGESGLVETTDFKGEDVFAAYAPLDFMGMHWGVVAEMSEDEVLEPVRTMRTFIIVAAGITLLVIIVIGLVVARNLANPIAAMTKVMHALAAGNLEVKILEDERKDEVGEMAEALRIFRKNAQEVEKLRDEQEETQRRSEEKQRAFLNQMADNFENTVSSVVEAVGTAAQDMETTAQGMSRTAAATSEQSNVVAQAAEQATGNVQTVASAAEELSASISEISRQVEQSRGIAQEAVDEAQQATDTVSSLSSAANKVGEVVELITSIAEQTNLLALNATIEAARAGEAGKGFAVVASEVKNLADQTARATAEITEQIDAMQSATTDAVSAISNIGQTINNINDISSSISIAVEEQGAATIEISKNVQEAASGTVDVTKNIENVNLAAAETGKASQMVLEASSGLNSQATSLKDVVQKFLQQVRGN
ncbi:methyl-accepting chemotaxis protein [Terasakiella sp.]|uniref:methyl-accepting chemotaxis protein n=1 Tax=Terasakiella sp. TaxID=2034861 RepID=UPI003AA7C43A